SALAPRPLLADAEAADERHLAVDADELPVVALHDAERVAEPDRRPVERVHPGARLLERLPERARGGPAPDPVVEHVDRNAFPRLVGERVAEAPADLVVADDVV